MTNTPPKCNTNKSQIKNGGLRDGSQVSCLGRLGSRIFKWASDRNWRYCLRSSWLLYSIGNVFHNKYKTEHSRATWGEARCWSRWSSLSRWKELGRGNPWWKWWEVRWQRSSLCHGHKKRWIGHLIWWWHHLYCQSESHMIAAETRTTTLPRASARTWRNTPWSLRWKLWQRWKWHLHWRLRWRFWKIFTSDVHLSSACKPLCLNECNE